MLLTTHVTPLLSQQEAWDELAPEIISNDFTLAHLLLLSSLLEPDEGGCYHTAQLTGDLAR